MEVPSMSWWRDRLRQLQGTSTIPGAAFESLSALLDVFYCQLSGLDDFGAIATARSGGNYDRQWERKGSSCL
jgi:hypothetical protein